MANHRLFFLLLLAATVTSAIIPPTTSSISPVTAPPPPPPQAQDLLQIHHQQQLNNIIDALIGAGDFTGWANVLSATGPTVLPLSATLFIPADNDDSSLPPPAAVAVDPLIFPYHIVPQRLTFAELHQFRPLSRLPTLLAKKSILITNTSLSNFTLDDSLLSHPDLYTTNTLAVHGIAHLLDYSVYGDPHRQEVVAPPPSPPSPPQAKKPLFVPEEGELISGHVHGSSAAETCLGGSVFRVLIGFTVLELLMQWWGVGN